MSYSMLSPFNDLDADFENLDVNAGALPPMPPHFFVPRLVDLPQNPIMDTLKHAGIYKPALRRFDALPAEVKVVTMDLGRPPSPKRFEDTIWLEAMKQRRCDRSQVVSWDGLRPSHTTKASSTGFLSEQDTFMFSAARHHVMPRIHTGDTNIMHVNQDSVLRNLKLTTLGISSMLHMWDSRAERFVANGATNGRLGVILVDGKDEVISSSLMAPFLRVGTLLRRLETLVARLRSRSSREGPSINAFAHGLSAILTFLRNQMSGYPPSNDEFSADCYMLSGILKHYTDPLQVLVALSSLCSRDEDMSPDDYVELNSQPQSLLSLIYDHLHTHIERQSPRLIKAMLAFLLSTTSQEYAKRVSRSVGYGVSPTQAVTHVIGERNDQYSIEPFEDDVDHRLVNRRDALEDTFPTFFSAELVAILPAAQKSLVLLGTAQPDHPMLKATASHAPIRWFWTEKEIQAAADGEYLHNRSDICVPLSEEIVPGEPASEPGLAQFQIFDLEPGSHIRRSVFDARFTTTSTSSLRAFIDTFPESLPPITPTLSHLTTLVFDPLLRHASALSSTLLSLFLNSSTSMNLRTHMELLRSYLLITAPPFKSRLAAALFSDSDDHEQTESSHNALSLRSLRRNPRKKGRDPSKPWAVGLAPALLDREVWPPVGADLSFLLRTVIVDSFEASFIERNSQDSRQRRLDEADSRLGFAIRDLPVGSGRDKWLNPLSIEALDFLYMDYKPPHPLEVLITPDILSQYQRMFAFLLRIIRVESALAALFRMTRPSDCPLFPTLVSSNKLLLHFRFLASSFVTNISSYVFDTAIGGNFDAFLAKLSPDASSTAPTGEIQGFSDVFSLAKAHAALLNDILSACLMRSSQRGVGDLLRDALERVLELAVLMGERKRGRLEEYQAAPLLEDLFQKFQTKMTALTKVLKSLDKNLHSSQIIPNPPSTTGIDHFTPRPPGGKEALSYLIVRLDPEWWSKAKNT